jgi:hypothetical protein
MSRLAILLWLGTVMLVGFLLGLVGAPFWLKVCSGLVIVIAIILQLRRQILSYGRRN